MTISVLAWWRARRQRANVEARLRYYGPKPDGVIDCLCGPPEVVEAGKIYRWTSAYEA